MIKTNNYLEFKTLKVLLKGVSKYIEQIFNWEYDT